MSARARGAAFPVLLAALLPLSPSRAQVEPGWCAVARTATSPGTAGITLVDTRAPGSPTVDVTNLPPVLTGNGSFGCASVLVARAGDRLIVGEKATLWGNASVFTVDLSGSAAATSQGYFVAGGFNTAFSAVVDMDWFGDDIAILCSSALAGTGPMAGEILGVFRPRLGPPGTPGTLVPVPTILPWGTPIALAIDEREGVAYVGFSDSLNGNGIWRVPFPGDGSVHVVLQPWAWCADLQALHVGADGGVYASSASETRLYEDINGVGVPTTVGGGADGGAIELVPADGRFLTLDRPSGELRVASGVQPPTTIAQLVGRVERVAYRATLEPYYESVPVPASPYRWQLGPNPGGFPALGSTGFSVTIEQPPAAVFGLAVFAFDEAVVPVAALGITLLVDPATAVPGDVLPAGQSATAALPIPPLPALLGATVRAQTLHWQGGLWAASPGLRVRPVL